MNTTESVNKEFTSKGLASLLIMIVCTLCWQACQPTDTFSEQTELPPANSASFTKKILSTEEHAQTRVWVAKTQDGFQLMRNGKPYFIKGAAGYQYFDKLKERGGNTIRIWHTDELEDVLDRAQTHGLNVIVGIDLGKPRNGFNYSDTTMVNAQRRKVENIVEKFKRHPAVLMWCLGNEVAIMHLSETSVWEEINHLSMLVKERDPFHPTTTSLEFNNESFVNFFRFCSDLDIISTNAFGSNIERMRDLNGYLKLFESRPILLSEWAFQGYWQAKTTDWMVPIEQNSTRKGEFIFQWHNDYLNANKHLIIGTCIFYWGMKQERTHTWFSLFLEDKYDSTIIRKTFSMDVLQYFWEGNWGENLCPYIDSLRLNEQTFVNGPPGNLFLEAGTENTSSVFFRDQEKDSISIYWEILPEGDYKQKIGGEAEQRPEPIPGLIADSSLARISFLSPEKSGAYRLFVYLYDEKDGGATANIPFFVTHRSVE